MSWYPRSQIILLSILVSSILSADDAVDDPNYWCDQAISQIINDLSYDDKNRLVEISNSSELLQFHMSWGQGIRNHLGLWKPDSKYYHSCCFKFGMIVVSDSEKDENGIPKLVAQGHPEDISSEIMKAIWEKVRIESEKDI